MCIRDRCGAGRRPDGLRRHRTAQAGIQIIPATTAGRNRPGERPGNANPAKQPGPPNSRLAGYARTVFTGPERFPHHHPSRTAPDRTAIRTARTTGLHAGRTETRLRTKTKGAACQRPHLSFKPRPSSVPSRKPAKGSESRSCPRCSRSGRCFPAANATAVWHVQALSLIHI